MALLDEVADGESIAVSVAGGKALVCHVEERKVALGLDGIANRLPLLNGRVDTSRVVGACVQQDNASLRGVLQILNHALEVQSDGVLVVVPVLLDLQTAVLEDGIVVGPAGSGNVDGLCAGVVALHEVSTDTQSTCAGDGLGDCYPVALDSLALGAVCEDCSGLGESWDTSDAGILLVEIAGDDLLLGGLDGGQNIWLSLVITVCANTQVDLLFEAVRLEGLGDT